jgi:hypothetical protein
VTCNQIGTEFFLLELDCKQDLFTTLALHINHLVTTVITQLKGYVTLLLVLCALPVFRSLADTWSMYCTGTQSQDVYIGNKTFPFLGSGNEL